MKISISSFKVILKRRTFVYISLLLVSSLLSTFSFYFGRTTKYYYGEVIMVFPEWDTVEAKEKTVLIFENPNYYTDLNVTIHTEISELIEVQQSDFKFAWGEVNGKSSYYVRYNDYENKYRSFISEIIDCCIETYKSSATKMGGLHVNSMMFRTNELLAIKDSKNNYAFVAFSICTFAPILYFLIIENRKERLSICNRVGDGVVINI